MTIYMITREHETETGNGSVYDDYVDESFGYFVEQKDAEARLFELHQSERDSYERHWERNNHEPWLRRKQANEEQEKNNNILVANGGTTTPVPHLYAEPVMKPWHTGMSVYKIVEIEEGKTRA